MKVFLTGGTGFIGQPLTKALRARNWHVVALVRRRDSEQARALVRLGAELVEGDVTRPESMRAPMEGADLVVHNAGHYEYGAGKAAQERMSEINVTGTDNVLGLAHTLGIPRTVYVSSVQAFGETGLEERDESFKRQAPCRTAYEFSKTRAHEVALEHQQRGLPLIVVCPNGVIGANDHSPWGYFLRLYLNRLLPPMSWAPGAIHASVEVSDLAEGIALAGEKGRIGETYLLGGECRPIRDHLGFWAGHPGAFKPLVWLPGPLAAALFVPMGPLLRMLGLPAFISREAVLASSTNWRYSHAKAEADLGWRPRSAEAMWKTTIDRELELLSRRKGQSLLQRLKPLGTVD